MCNIDRSLEAQLLAMGLNFITKAIEASMMENNTPSQSTDVLTVATTAYQQGKITKQQYFAVINALDEPTTVQTSAWTVPNTVNIVRS